MKRNLRKKIIIFFIVFAIIVLYVYICVSKNLIAIGQYECDTKMSSAIYYGIDNTIGEVEYKDLYNVVTDSLGNIIMITTDGIKINLLAKKLADKTYYYSKLLTQEGVNVPLGAFTGLAVFSGLGKKVKIDLITVNSVKVEIISNFIDAGINQTKQSVFIKIIPECYIVAGLKTYKVQTEFEFMCYENIILGKVPNAVFYSNTYTAS